MAGRPREFDADEALAVIKDVFWERGFEATSLDDLVEASGVPRQSLYNVFGDKQSLFERAVEHYAEQQLGTLVRQIDEASDPLEGLAGVLNRFRTGRPTGLGCLITNELGNAHHPELRDRMNAELERVEKAATAAFGRAIDAGAIAGEPGARERGRAFFCALQGLSIMSKSGVGKARLRDAVEGALYLLR